MDATARIDTLLDAAVRHGLLEERDGDLRATKRWRDALVRASHEMALAAAECPTCPPPPDPIGDCVRRALQTLKVDLDTRDWDDMIGVLTQFELATMPPEKRSQNGYRMQWP